MGAYNQHSPAPLGLEWRPTIQTDVTLSGPGQGLALRIMPGSTTIDTLYPFFKSVSGTSGIGVEILTTLEPPVATTPVALADGTVGMGEHHYVGTTTGLISSGWEDQSNVTTAATLIAAIDEFPANTTDYIRNVSAVPSNGKLQFAGRGNDTALTGKRIDAIEIVVLHRTNPNTNTLRPGPRVQGYLNLGGQTYLDPRSNSQAPADGKWRQPAIGFWKLNPSTNKPWTLAEANNLVAAGATDEWGLQIDSSPVAAEGYNVSMLVMVVFTTSVSGGGTGGVGDVRKGFLYRAESPSVGWNTLTLGSTSAETAATYYYLHLFPLSASGQIVVPVLRDSRADFQTTTLASQTGEHRIAYTTTITASGVIKSYAQLPRGSMWPIELSAGGVFNAQSQAYAELANLDEDSSSTANLAQQITTTGGTPPHYASLRGPVGWASASKPDAPLNIQIQHGANANIGTGTVLANIFVQPEDLSQQVIDRAISLGPGIDPPATTKLFVLFDSAASPGIGYRIGRGDTRSDATTGPTVAQIEGQSQGGQTDSQSYGVVDFDRYDLLFALLGNPGEVGGTPAPSVPVLTATVVTGL